MRNPANVKLCISRTRCLFTWFTSLKITVLIETVLKIIYGSTHSDLIIVKMNQSISYSCWGNKPKSINKIILGSKQSIRVGQYSFRGGSMLFIYWTVTIYTLRLFVKLSSAV